MSSPPAPKRRRIDSLGIHKPFVSPLKRAGSAPSPQPTPLRNSNLRNATTPQVLAAQQEIRHLDHRIRELRAQNAVLQQATTTTTAAPSRLETKWRKASQAAAEEVFSDFAARIRDSGGYTAFVKRQSEYKPFADHNDDDDDKQDSQGDEEDWRDEMGDVLTARGKNQRRRENADDARNKENDDVEGQEEHELGMGCMLQVLNIPPEVIGWDEQKQDWK